MLNLVDMFSDDHNKGLKWIIKTVAYFSIWENFSLLTH